MRRKWELLEPTLDERARRRWAGTEADATGWGGVAAVARATGLAISIVRKGRGEVRAGASRDDVVNVRRSTGARPYEEHHPEVRPALEKLVSPATRGAPDVRDAQDEQEHSGLGGRPRQGRNSSQRSNGGQAAALSWV